MNQKAQNLVAACLNCLSLVVLFRKNTSFKTACAGLEILFARAQTLPRRGCAKQKNARGILSSR